MAKNLQETLADYQDFIANKYKLYDVLSTPEIGSELRQPVDPSSGLFDDTTEITPDGVIQFDTPGAKNKYLTSKGFAVVNPAEWSNPRFSNMAGYSIADQLVVMYGPQARNWTQTPDGRGNLIFDTGTGKPVTALGTHDFSAGTVGGNGGMIGDTPLGRLFIAAVLGAPFALGGLGVGMAGAGAAEGVGAGVGAGFAGEGAVLAPGAIGGAEAAAAAGLTSAEYTAALTAADAAATAGSTGLTSGITNSLTQTLVDMGLPFNAANSLPSISSLAQKAALNAASQYLQTGKIDVGQIVTSLAAGAAGNVAGSIAGSAFDDKLLSSIASGAARGVTTAGLSGGDISQAALTGAVTSGAGYLAQGTPVPTSVVNALISSAVTGKPLSDTLINAGVNVIGNAGLDAVKDVFKQDPAPVTTRDSDAAMNPPVDTAPRAGLDSVTAAVDTPTTTDTQNTDGLMLARDRFKAAMDEISQGGRSPTVDDADTAIYSSADYYGIDPAQLAEFLHQEQFKGYGGSNLETAPKPADQGQTSGGIPNLATMSDFSYVGVDSGGNGVYQNPATGQYVNGGGDPVDAPVTAGTGSGFTNGEPNPTGGLPTTTTTSGTDGGLPPVDTRPKTVMDEVLVTADRDVGDYSDRDVGDVSDTFVPLPYVPAPDQGGVPTPPPPYVPPTTPTTPIKIPSGGLPTTTPTPTPSSPPSVPSFGKEPTTGTTESNAVFGFGPWATGTSLKGTPIKDSFYQGLPAGLVAISAPNAPIPYTPARMEKFAEYDEPIEVAHGGIMHLEGGGTPEKQTPEQEAQATIKRFEELLASKKEKDKEEAKAAAAIPDEMFSASAFLKPAMMRGRGQGGSGIYAGIPQNMATLGNSLSIMSPNIRPISPLDQVPSFIPTRKLPNFAEGGSLHPAFVQLLRDRGMHLDTEMIPGPEDRMYAKHQERGFAVGGAGTGQSDDIPTMLSDGEYVFDADTVSALGDGSSKAGAAILDKMRAEIRKHKRGAPIDDIPPKAKSPLSYLKMARKGK